MTTPLNQSHHLKERIGKDFVIKGGHHGFFFLALPILVYKNRLIENCFQGNAIQYGQCHSILMKFDFLFLF